MASGLFNRAPLLLSAAAGTAGCAFVASSWLQRQDLQSWKFNPMVYRLDSYSSAPARISEQRTFPAQSPLESRSSSTKPSDLLSPRSIKQLSAGSICGLLAGLAVSTFSKPLALLLGLLVVGGQLCESYLGIQPLPYGRIERFLRSKISNANVDVQSVVRENAAFKLSFGAVFALSAFADF